MVKFTISKIYVLGFIWTLSLLFPLILAGYIPIIDLKKILSAFDGASIRFSDINYIGDSDSMPVTVFPGPRMVIDDIDLTLKFRIDRYSDYANIFQTAPFNDGARLELYSSHRGDIKLGLFYPMNNETKLLLLDDEVQINKEYLFQLKAHNNKIYVYLNDKLAGMGNLNSIPFSEFILGNAMVDTKPFVGQIYLDKCFVYKVSIGKWFLKLFRSRTAYLAYGIFVLLVILSVSLLIFYFVYYEGMSDKDNRIFPPVKR
jgi:hypothetical protein